jgi:hypothetical protein
VQVVLGLIEDDTSPCGATWFTVVHAPIMGDKDFGSFEICGEGPYPKTFLLRGPPANGEQL